MSRAFNMVGDDHHLIVSRSNVLVRLNIHDNTMADISSAKYQNKRLKLAGPQKLRYYCQVCQKQCRDSNGFKNHVASPSHMGKVADMDMGSVEDFLKQFSSDFVRLLRLNHGTKKINANRFYQEFILDKEHVHMNATKWSSLTAFVKYLGREGLVKVENNDFDNEFALEISYIDRAAMIREGEAKKQKADDSQKEDEVTAQLLQKRKEMGKRNLEEYEKTKAKEADLKDNNKPVKPVKLSLSLKKRKIEKRSLFGKDDD